MTDNTTYSTVCPFCNKVHQLSRRYINVVCDCGGKRYANTGDWLNRKTGVWVRAPKAKCGCEKCKQWQTNSDEVGWACISFGFTVRILKNMLECDGDLLTEKQKEAIKTTIEIVEKRDRTLHNQSLF